MRDGAAAAARARARAARWPAGAKDGCARTRRLGSCLLGLS
jgi:hypothetical protein